MNKNTSKKLTRQKRLATYSTVANLALAGGLVLTTPVQAAEVVINVDPDVTLTPGQDFDIDFNQDSTPEFQVDSVNYGAPGVILREFGDPVEGVIGYISPYGFRYPSALAPGTTIGPSDAFLTNNLIYVGYGGYGQFQGNNDNIIGVRFSLGGDTYYGWILLDVAAGSTSVTVRAYGYDDSPGTATNTPSPTAISLATSTVDAVQSSTATSLAVGGLTLLSALSLWWRQRVVARLKRTDA